MFTLSYHIRPDWKKDYKEAAIICTVFAVTGTSSLMVVRPVLKSVLGLEGSLIEGPNSYRVASVLLVSPAYATILMFLVRLPHA
jgi:hypothetical protein